jgi:hypothetical protein
VAAAAAVDDDVLRLDDDVGVETERTSEEAAASADRADLRYGPWNRSCSSSWCVNSSSKV